MNLSLVSSVSLRRHIEGWESTISCPEMVSFVNQQHVILIERTRRQSINTIVAALVASSRVNVRT